MDVTTEQAPGPAPHTGFAAIVADVLHRAGVQQQDPALIGLVETIDGAHQVRVRMLQREIEDEKRAALAYASMDRANQTVMQYAKRIMGQAFEVNGKQHAYCESIGEMRKFLRDMVSNSIAAKKDSLPLQDLRELIEWEMHEPAPSAPVILGMAVDHRFTYGLFQHSGNGETSQFTFLGWSLLIHTPPLKTGLEPTFLRPLGEPATRMQMSIDGWELQELH